MGMFDWIKYGMKCPECGSKVGGFQSKDRGCSLSKLNFWEVNHFYSICDKCDTWIDFNRVKLYPKVSIKHFKMSTNKGEKQ